MRLAGLKPGAYIADPRGEIKPPLSRQIRFEKELKRRSCMGNPLFATKSIDSLAYQLLSTQFGLVSSRPMRAGKGKTYSCARRRAFAD